MQEMSSVFPTMQPLGARLLRGAGILGSCGLLTACIEMSSERGSSPVAPQPVSAGSAPAPYRTDTLVGKWGVASFREEKDRKRTEVQARAQCKLPYTIAKGPTDGVMMYFADDPKLYELKLKGSKDGKTYLGFEGEPGDWQDREILHFSDTVIVMRFVDPEINGRYGTYVYVRCTKA